MNKISLSAVIAAAAFFLSPVCLGDESMLQAMIDDFECLGSPQTEPSVPANRPQVRLMMCGYESQCALQFAAYLIMREKLGFNVTFYPTLDYDTIWNEMHWDTDWSGYPRKYFEWLADDEGDLQFEIWQTQMMRTDENGDETFNGESEFILKGKVDFGGFVGAYGEESVWVPSYVLDDEPDFFIPDALRENDEYRERLIDAAAGTYDGALDATDFVELYTEMYTVPDAEGVITPNPYDLPTDSRPIVWTSTSSYFGSDYSRDLTSDLNMSFVATGSESALATMITELYAARQPLLAYIYTLDVNFGRVDASGELQQFEKLVYPRNPDQSANDPCFEAKDCQFPVAPIMKLANPLLRERFPEAYEFFNRFKMTTSQVNLLVSKFLTINDDWANYGAMSSTEKWLHAACDWMKDEKSHSTWSTGAWDVPIVRYDCELGCGFGDEGNGGIGGECNYYNGECECWQPELFADEQCRLSCPGLSEPMFNESSGEYYFEFCSGHGVCNVKTRAC